MTGPYAGFGRQLKDGAAAAVKDIDDAGGVTGSRLVLEISDDACDPTQAVAVAHDLAGRGVKFVAGHVCSGSSIPASKIYEEEGIVQITPASSNPRLTDEGGWNVHRVAGRDDAQGAVAGAFLARRYAGRRVAIIHDNSSYGRALAEETKRAMNAAGLEEAIYEAYSAGGNDYSALVSRFKDVKG
jgi:branched-chain amino acid transport system substrate-binding protein